MKSMTQKLRIFESGTEFENVLKVYNDQMDEVSIQNTNLCVELKKLSSLYSKIECKTFNDPS